MGGYPHALHPGQVQEGDNLYCCQTIRALEEGEEFEYIPIETEGAVGPQFSTPKKGDDPVIAQLVEHFKCLLTSGLKQIMTALNREMDARHVPQESPSKPDVLGSHHQDVSSILHSLIKEGP